MMHPCSQATHHTRTLASYGRFLRSRKHPCRRVSAVPTILISDPPWNQTPADMSDPSILYGEFGVNPIMNFSASHEKTRSRPNVPLRTIVAGSLVHPVSAEATSFDQALLEHCEAVLRAVSRGSLVVLLDLTISARCPEWIRGAVFRIADELLTNAVEHGFYNRQRGRILVQLTARGLSELALCVLDDGWGFGRNPITEGNGFHLLRQLGELSVNARGNPYGARTAVSVVVPVRRGGCSARLRHGPIGTVEKRP